MEEKFAQAKEDNEENMSVEHTQSIKRRRISRDCRKLSKTVWWMFCKSDGD